MISCVFLVITILFVNINHGFETTDDVVLQKQKLLKAEKDRVKSNCTHNCIKIFYRNI